MTNFINTMIESAQFLLRGQEWTHNMKKQVERHLVYCTDTGVDPEKNFHNI